jgi:hypothetical protein
MGGAVRGVRDAVRCTAAAARACGAVRDNGRQDALASCTGRVRRRETCRYAQRSGESGSAVRAASASRGGKRDWSKNALSPLAMRRSARVAAAVDARTSALPQLPVSLAARVFRFLPVDDRARAALVCRGWRAFLADAALWTRLDLPSTGGVARERITDAFLRGAAAMARGQLQWLDLGLEDFGGLHPVTQAAVLEVVAANAGSLRELCVQNLHTPSGFSVEMDTLEALARTAPLLRRLKADVVCSWQDAARLLRAEPPFASLQLCTLTVVMDNLAGALQVAGLELVSPFAAALADTALLVTMSRLDIALADIQQPEVLDALVDALLPSRLPQLAFWGCKMAAPAPLARLLRGSSLTCLACNSTAGRVRPGRPRPSAAVRVSPWW